MVKFTVYGEPKAKGRPRVSVRKSGDGEKTFARAYTPKQTVIYENQVKICLLYTSRSARGMRLAFVK